MTLVADNMLIFLFSKVKSLYSMLYLLQNLNFQKNQKVFLILLCLIGTGCQKPIALNEYTFRGSSMGTTFLVKIAALEAKSLRIDFESSSSRYISYAISRRVKPAFAAILMRIFTIIKFLRHFFKNK